MTSNSCISNLHHSRNLSNTLQKRKNSQRNNPLPKILRLSTNLLCNVSRNSTNVQCASSSAPPSALTETQTGKVIINARNTLQHENESLHHSHNEDEEDGPRYDSIFSWPGPSSSSPKNLLKLQQTCVTHLIESVLTIRRGLCQKMVERRFELTFVSSTLWTDRGMQRALIGASEEDKGFKEKRWHQGWCLWPAACHPCPQLRIIVAIFTTNFI